MANISSVADIHTPGQIVECAEWAAVEQATFEPNSAQVNLTVSAPPPYGNPLANSPVGPYPVAGTFTMNGYWEPGEVGYLDYQGEGLDNPVTTPFTPGVYTVGIENMWGQAMTLHFEVK